MDFTREPIIETVITPREGYRLVVRSSKVMGQEEHFVEAVEVVSFGNAFFFRSIERPRQFLVPVGDYEIFEMRETRVVLKVPQGQESTAKTHLSKEEKEPSPVRMQEGVTEESGNESVGLSSSGSEVQQQEGRKRRERKKPFRRRRGQYREETREEMSSSDNIIDHENNSSETREFQEEQSAAEMIVDPKVPNYSAEAVAPSLRAVLPPPTTLIRDDLQRLRDDEMFRGAFFLSEEKQEDDDDDDSTLESFQDDAFSSHEQKQEEQSDGITKESSPEEPFLFEQTIEADLERDVEDPLSR